MGRHGKLQTGIAAIQGWNGSLTFANICGAEPRRRTETRAFNGKMQVHVIGMLRFMLDFPDPPLPPKTSKNVFLSKTFCMLQLAMVNPEKRRIQLHHVIST
jgi:hypothetical protein